MSVWTYLTLFILYQQGPQFQRNRKTVKNISILILPNLKNSVPDLSFSFCCLVAKSFSTLLRPNGLQPTSLLCPWDVPGKNSGVDCHFLLRELFPTQGSNLRLLDWQVDSLPLSHRASLFLYVCWGKIVLKIMQGKFFSKVNSQTQK